MQALISSLEPKGLQKQTFQKPALSPMRKKLAEFFCFFRAWQTSGNILLDRAMSSGNHCASHKIIFVTPKSFLKTQFFEKGYFSNKKMFLCIVFSLIIEHHKQ